MVQNDGTKPVSNFPLSKSNSQVLIRTSGFGFGDPRH